jgi:hypothetical protein
MPSQPSYKDVSAITLADSKAKKKIVLADYPTHGD